MLWCQRKGHGVTVASAFSIQLVRLAFLLMSEWLKLHQSRDRNPLHYAETNDKAWPMRPIHFPGDQTVRAMEVTNVSPQGTIKS